MDPSIFLSGELDGLSMFGEQHDSGVSQRYLGLSDRRESTGNEESPIVCSSFELLPAELVWEIIAYVPESIPELRLVSCFQRFFFSFPCYSMVMMLHSTGPLPIFNEIIGMRAAYIPGIVHSPIARGLTGRAAVHLDPGRESDRGAD